MILKIKLLKPFSDVTGESEIKIDFNGSTLDNLIKTLVKRYPSLKKEFFTDSDELTDYICIFINDKPFSALQGLTTKLKDNDELLFFIPISGG